MNAHPVRRPSSQRLSPSSLERLESRLLFVRVEGIDVSQFQGVIDWNQVAANGKQFVFMRSSRTNLTKDPTFDRNRVDAAAAGLLVGAYHYTLPNNTGNAGPLIDPVLDAQKFFAAGGPAMQTGNLRPVIDAEAGGLELGIEAYSQWISNFSNELERQGVTSLHQGPQGVSGDEAQLLRRLPTLLAPALQRPDHELRIDLADVVQVVRDGACDVPCPVGEQQVEDGQRPAMIDPQPLRPGEKRTRAFTRQTPHVVVVGDGALVEEVERLRGE